MKIDFPSEGRRQYDDLENPRMNSFRSPLALLILVAPLLVGCEPPKSAEALRLSKKVAELEDKLKSSRASESDDGSSEVERYKTAVETFQELATVQIESMDGDIEKDSAGNVTKVSFEEVPIDNAKIVFLKAFPDLSHLVITGPQVNSKTIDIVKELPTLEKLELSLADINDADLEKLTALSNLTYLQLFRTNITDAGFKSLAKLPKIQQIRCGQTRIGDDALKNLQNAKTITALDLSDCNRVSDTGLGYLKGMNNLRFLKVWGPQITDKGVSALKDLPNLEVLGFNDTKVTDEGMQYLAGKPRLKEVHLFRTLVGDQGMEYLAQCPGMKYMNLRDTAVSDKGLASVGKLVKLEKLDLSEVQGITDEGLTSLGKLTEMKDINFWLTKISDPGVESLKPMVKLQRLNLDKTAITDKSLEVIPAFKDLTYLHIGSNGDRITDEGLKHLLKLTRLKELIVTHNLKVTDAVVAEFYEQIPGIDVFGP